MSVCSKNAPPKSVLKTQSWDRLFKEAYEYYLYPYRILKNEILPHETNPSQGFCESPVKLNPLGDFGGGLFQDALMQHMLPSRGF